MQAHPQKTGGECTLDCTLTGNGQNLLQPEFIPRFFNWHLWPSAMRPCSISVEGYSQCMSITDWCSLFFSLHQTTSHCWESKDKSTSGANAAMTFLDAEKDFVCGGVCSSQVQCNLERPEEVLNELVLLPEKPRYSSMALGVKQAAVNLSWMRLCQ